MSPIKSTSPLYLHLSDGSNFISVDKLQGPANYRSWKRSLKISLASKRKLGFIAGVVKRDVANKLKQEAWDICNSMVISWILANVTEFIKKSIMFVESTSAIWKQLEQRYTVASGSRKYKLNKIIYETKQEGKCVTDYYTDLKGLWEGLESLNGLPPITNVNAEINAFVSALNNQKEEMKFFQFLNGLDDTYTTNRSHLLMMSVLPSVEEAGSSLRYKENQRDMLKSMKEEVESSAMYNKSTDLNCSVCGKT